MSLMKRDEISLPEFIIRRRVINGKIIEDEVI